MQIYKDIESLAPYKNLVVTIGSFDGVHRAHQLILKRVTDLAKAINGTSVVISFYPHPRTVINPDFHFNVINTQEERNALIQQTGIDILLIFPFTKFFADQTNGDFMDRLISAIDLKAIVLGYNHNFGKNREGNINTLKTFAGKYGFDIIEVEKQLVDKEAVSSSTIRKMMAQGRIDRVNAMLGYQYFVEISIVQVDINHRQCVVILSNPAKLIPPVGSYDIQIEQYQAKLYVHEQQMTLSSADDMDKILENQKYNIYFF